MAKDGNVRVWAWDGSRFREIVVDVSGHPQVDALSVANPPNLDKAISKLIDKSVVNNSQDMTTGLASGTSEIITFIPPTGKLWKFISMYLNAGAPPGATSGTHSFWLYNPDETTEALHGRSTYGSILQFNYGYWFIANSLARPTDQANLGIVLSRLFYDNSSRLKFVYYNGTDVSQTNTRTYRVSCLEEYAA